MTSYLPRRARSPLWGGQRSWARCWGGGSDVRLVLSLSSLPVAEEPWCQCSPRLGCQTNLKPITSRSAAPLCLETRGLYLAASVCEAMPGITWVLCLAERLSPQASFPGPSPRRWQQGCLTGPFLCIVSKAKPITYVHTTKLHISARLDPFLWFWQMPSCTTELQWSFWSLLHPACCLLLCCLPFAPLCLEDSTKRKQFVCMFIACSAACPLQSYHCSFSRMSDLSWSVNYAKYYQSWLDFSNSPASLFSHCCLCQGAAPFKCPNQPLFLVFSAFLKAFLCHSSWKNVAKREPVLCQPAQPNLVSLFLPPYFSDLHQSFFFFLPGWSLQGQNWIKIFSMFLHGL